MSFFNTSQKGFVILLAIIISASILMIGAGIFSSAFKQTILASTSTESQIALFVADTGMECALYAEFVGAGVPTMCAGEVLDASAIDQVGNCSTLNTGLCSYNFFYTIPGAPGCGKVSIQRNTNEFGDIGTGGTGTSIIARGYNFCTNGGTAPDTNNSTLVERRLEVWYPNAAAAPGPDPASVGFNPSAGSTNPSVVVPAQVVGGGGGSILNPPPRP